MRTSLALGAALLLLGASPAHAHRLDEYLQATILSVGKDRVKVQLRLTPGVAVFPSVLAGIDANADGLLSEAEQRAYAERVGRELSLAIDGAPLPLRLATWKFASVGEMREGRGDIQIELDAAVPAGGGDRRLTFDNRHQRAISVYLVNALVPPDPDIRVTGQARSYEQSAIQLDYAQTGWAGFGSMVRLGMHHITQGTDHLLFLLVLLLPAPLLAASGRWGGYAGARASAVRLLRMVTAFTLGHSLTLAAAATGVVRAPSDAVEVLVAVSILISAVHALRPLFPGRESLVAGGFGLVHGLAFATMIAGYGMTTWQTALAVLGFNVGIELMQIAVVALTMPWLLILARTRLHAPLRAATAVAAGVASIGWIGERAFGLSNPAGPWVERAADAGPAFVAVLALLALGTVAWHVWAHRASQVSADRTTGRAPAV
jgi:hypothetical protein